MGGRRLIAAACAAASLALSAAAGASPAGDFYAVYAAWNADGPFPHCKFAKSRLQNAVAQAAQVPELATYSPTFPSDVKFEIAFIDAGGCRGISRPPSAARLRRSALRRVTIVGIHPRGRETIVLKNSGRRPVRLTGATLRDRSGHRVRLHGVLRGRRARQFASRGVWDDGGDVVKLVDRRRLVVRQRGYGRLAGIVAF